MGIGLGELIGLEMKVWQALAEGDVDAVERLLSDDFFGVSPTGFSDRNGHVAQIEAGPTVGRFDLSEARMLVVSDAAAMLSYRAVYVRVGHDVLAESMYVSSLWCKRDERWLNVFSQDTPHTGIPVV